MASVVLEGENLGERHRHFNSLVKKAIANQTALEPINYDDPDVDNLLKIDVASTIRNVEYILQVLTSEDMLYVSRAIKKCTWLITDDQYAHIINPKYLKDELFPKMTSKGKSKLILAIRLHLRDPARVEAFYEFYADDLQIAQKWLPYCSPEFIENIVSKHAREIKSQTLKRLCEISFKYFKIYATADNTRYFKRKVKITMFLLNDHTEEYLDIIESLKKYDVPKFKSKATETIMRKCHDRIVKNFMKYACCIHLPTFAKHLKKEIIEDFLTQQAENKKMKHWVKFENIKHFVQYLPIDRRFEFVRKLFIDNIEKKKSKSKTVNPEDDAFCLDGGAQRRMQLCSLKMSSSRHISASNAHIYRWYRFAPFESAFNDLKKLIRAESNPAERTAMLSILLHCTRRNPRHIQTLLQFYREKHINEPFKFKVQFANTFISLNAIHQFDENTWNTLNDIFTSMEVYIESENSVPFCVKAIIVYKLLHNQTIPEIIEKKHTFDTFEDYRKKLNEKEQNILFDYLYNLELKKLHKEVTNEVDMIITIGALNNILKLVTAWKKRVEDYPKIFETIRYLITIKKEKSWKTSLSDLYQAQNLLRRNLFEDSLALKQTDEVCVNALKHDPGLLDRYEAEIAAMRSNDAISLRKSLGKLRIYWANSLAQTWIDAYKNQLEKPNGHKAAINGICILLPRKQFFEVVANYAPVETKINWSDTDATLLSLRKNIAQQMQFVRPPPNLEGILTYAKEDYLQYALPSLNAILYNMSSANTSECIQRLVNAPVSLQKHGIRLAFNKLQLSEIKDLIHNIWKNSKNSSIKTVLFKQTYDLLIKEKNESNINQIWELLSNFIDKLSQEENRIIYLTLGNVKSLPMSVRPACFVKSYLYLISLPTKANCEPIIKSLERQAVDFIELLEPAFVEDVLLKSTAELMAETNVYDMKLTTRVRLLTSYILSIKDEETQYKKYEKVLHPVLESCYKSWGQKKDKSYMVRDNCKVLLKDLLIYTKKHIQKTATVPAKMFKDIQTKIVAALAPEENYAILSYWNITVLFVESVAKYLKDLEKESSAEKSGDEQVKLMKTPRCMPGCENQSNDPEWEKACSKIAMYFGEACLNFLKTDISFENRSIFTIFASSLCEVFTNVDFKSIHRLNTFVPMLADSNIIVSYLVVLEALRFTYFYGQKLEVKQNIIDIIKTHPSTEVKIYYHIVFKNYFLREME